MLWMWAGMNKRPNDTLRSLVGGKHSVSSLNMHPEDWGRIYLHPFIRSENAVRCHKPEDHCMNIDSSFRSFFEDTGNLILLPSWMIQFLKSY